MKLASTSLIMAAAIAAEAFSIASASSSPRSNQALHHRGLAHKMRRAVGLSKDSPSHNSKFSGSVLEKRRSYSGTATWYGAGVSEGACGVYSSASDNIVALNTNLYGDEDAQSSWCGKTLVITGNGVTQTATVVDACPSCPSDGDLDMSTGLFQSFGYSLGKGEFDISWRVAGSGGGSSSSSHHNHDSSDDDEETTTHHHTSTHTHSHTHTTHTPTSTKTTESSTSTTRASSTSTSAPATTAASTSSTTTAAPASTGASTGTTSTQARPDAENLKGMSEVMQGLLNIANAGQA